MYGLKMTNGDVMMMTYSNAEIIVMPIENCIRMFFNEIYYADFNIEWWNSLYRVEQCKECENK